MELDRMLKALGEPMRLKIYQGQHRIILRADTASEVRKALAVNCAVLPKLFWKESIVCALFLKSLVSQNLQFHST